MPDPSPFSLRLSLDPGDGAARRAASAMGDADGASRATAAQAGIEAALGRLMGVSSDGVAVLQGDPDAALEAALLTLIQPGDVVVAAVNGPLSAEMAERAGRAGAEVVAVDHEAGEPVDLARVEAALWARGARLCLGAHADPFTGVFDDPAPLCALAHEHGALPLIECGASLGVVTVDALAWGAQVVCTGAAAGLGAPAGVAVLGLGPEARRAMAARRAPPVTWTLDLTRGLGAGGLPGPLRSALQAALAQVEAQGPAVLREARGRLRDGLAAGLAALGLEAATPAARRAPGLIVALAPGGVDAGRVRLRMRDAFGVEVSLFEGAAGARGWRLGLLGAELGPPDVRLALAAFADALNVEGVRGDLAAALAAAEPVLTGR